MWAKAVVVWGVARPGSETCKTNLISKRSFKFEVSSVKSERSAIQCSDFKLRTSHFKLPAQRPRGRGCVQNKPNFALAAEDVRRGRSPARRIESATEGRPHTVGHAARSVRTH